MIIRKKKKFTHEITVSRSPMKATEKHFDSLRKTQVITKVSQNAAWIWHFFYKKKVKIGNFLRKSMSLDERTEFECGRKNQVSEKI